MATVLKCPGCQVSMDVSHVPLGSNIRCPDCGQMSRIPTGNTAVRAKPAELVAPPLPSGGTATRVRERGRTMTRPAPAPPRSSNTGVIIGVCVGVAVVAGIGFAMMSGGSEPPASTRPARGPKETPGPTPPTPPAGVVQVPNPLQMSSGRTDDPERANWEDILKQLRTGGGFEDPNSPQAAVLDRVRKMGKAAYPHLIKQIDHEDVMLGRAAVTVLKELTKRESVLPNETTKAKIKGEWEEWVKANP